MLTLLWSDIALWGAVLALAGMLVYLLRARRNRSAWIRIFRRKSTPVCAAIIAIYVAIALLDSIHVSSENRVESVLDKCLQRTLLNREKTYSEPLAAVQFSKEGHIDASGRMHRIQPRLQHGGASLTTLDDSGSDLRWRVFVGVFVGAMFAAIGFSTLYCFRRRWVGRFQFIIALVLCSGIGAAISLSREYHLLGTDKIGQDLLYRALKGCRTAMVMGLIVTLIATPLALTLGMLAGYFGRRLDDVVQFSYITMGSIPGVLLIAAGMLVFQSYMPENNSLRLNDARLLCLSALLAVTGIPGLCRLIRAETLRLRESGFVNAARVLGAGHLRVLAVHLLPNLIHLVLVSMILRFSGLVLSEAVLTYVGIGVDPSAESWGAMLNAARFELAREPMVWWNLTTAFIFMIGLVLPVNVLGETLRDAFDPTLHIQ